MKIVNHIISAISGVVFPKVCVLCGMPLSGNQRFLCSVCLEARFEQAVVNSEERINLPESVANRLALWNFDKGDHLQDLLHMLKYKRLTGVGLDIGRALGRKTVKNFSDEILSGADSYLLPIPLHPKKMRLRGYNQAYFIAKGVHEVVGMEIVPKDAVIRVKNTKTQTGFNIEKRQANMRDAFQVQDSSWVKNKILFIVDDVFTTGATGFELAATLHQAGAKNIFIITVAQA